MTEVPPIDRGGRDGAPLPEAGAVPSRVLEFFFFPLVMVAVGVGIFVLFGLITAEGKGPRDYLGLIRTGDSNRRWQAAFELSKVIGARAGTCSSSDPRLVTDMASLFEEAKADDPRVRRFLALALGRLGDARAVPALLEYLAGVAARGGDGPGDAHLRDLGPRCDRRPRGGPRARRPRRRTRTPASARRPCTPCGSSRSAEATAALEGALGDPVGDVRWNAAAGARPPRRPRRGARPRADARPRAARPGRGGHRRSRSRGSSCRPSPGGAPSGRETRRPARRRWRQDDPSLKVRAAARRGLEPRGRESGSVTLTGTSSLGRIGRHRSPSALSGSSSMTDAKDQASSGGAIAARDTRALEAGEPLLPPHLHEVVPPGRLDRLHRRLRGGPASPPAASCSRTCSSSPPVLQGRLPRRVQRRARWTPAGRTRSGSGSCARPTASTP